jgi:hypothetical protein
MNSARAALNLCHKAARITALALTFSPLFFSSSLAQTSEAAKPETTTSVAPYSLFQYSALTSSTDTVNATRVPVVDSTGKIHYWDVSLLFDANSAGDLTLAAGYPKISKSANPNSANFKAGTYVAPSIDFGGTGIIVVAGPSVLPGGGTAWTISLPNGSNGGTDPNSAVWYVEPIASNPLAARIQAAGITSTQWSYGLGSGYGWAGNSLLGFMQVGNTLTIADFTQGNFPYSDHSMPVAQITYTLKP